MKYKVFLPWLDYKFLITPCSSVLYIGLAAYAYQAGEYKTFPSEGEVQFEKPDVKAVQH